MDWDVWRIMASERYSVPTPDMIRHQWSLEDVLQAHDVLDMYDDLKAKENAELARKVKQ